MENSICYHQKLEHDMLASSVAPFIQTIIIHHSSLPSSYFKCWREFGRFPILQLNSAKSLVWCWNDHFLFNYCSSTCFQGFWIPNCITTTPINKKEKRKKLPKCSLLINHNYSLDFLKLVFKNYPQPNIERFILWNWTSTKKGNKVNATINTFENFMNRCSLRYGVNLQDIIQKAIIQLEVIRQC